MSERDSICASSEKPDIKPIPNFSGYYARTDGTIWRDTPDGLLRLHSTCGDRGYMFVSLYDDQGFCRRVKIGVLVLLAFVGSRPRGWEACHSPDPTRSNDRLENLRWGTKEDNELDKSIHGTRARGIRVGGAKLTDDQIIEIRKRSKDGEGPTVLGKAFGVTAPAISNIIAGRTRKVRTNGEPF